MLFFLVLAAALWALGWHLGTPRRARWLMIGLVYVAILAASVALPSGHPLRAAIGGSTAEWLTVGALAGAVWLYAEGLKRLRARVLPENRPAEAPKAGAAERLRRQARHIALREIGGPGQKRLGAAKVLVVGAGGLGSPALQYLAAAGVGTIGVIDDDTVEQTNLQRQVIHTDARIGMPKVFSAEMAMVAQNPTVAVRPYNRRLEAGIAEALFADYDLILDGTDNFETRYLVNRAAVATGKPLIAAALSQWEGQISVYAPKDGTPCYACIFPEAPAPGLAPSCAEAGVLGPLPGVVGAMMAVEAVKEITGAGESLRGRMLIYDALHAEARVIALKKRPGCAVCGG
jgi:molybdopterin/thiamine biosynthesis adenylyltransferase